MDQLQEEICTCVPGGVCFRSLSPFPLAEEKGTVQILWGKVNGLIVNNAFGSIGQNIVIGVGIQFAFYLWARKIENQKLKRKAEEKLERRIAEEQSNNERIQREADREKRILDKIQAVQDAYEAVSQISSNPSNASLQRAQNNASTEIGATEESCSTAAHVTVDMRAILAAEPSESQRRALQTAHNTTATGYKGSHIFQITIPFREGELCDKLDELQQTLESKGDNSSDHHPTLQLGHWGIFDRDTKQLKPFVEEADAGRRLTVPNILMCTRLSHDKIAIFGVDLKADEATRVYAATAQQKHLLDIAWDRDEIVIKDVSASRGIASLPSTFTNMADIWIYATKPVQVIKHERASSIMFHSRAVRIETVDVPPPLKWPVPTHVMIVLIFLLALEGKGLMQIIVIASLWLNITWGFLRLVQNQPMTVSQAVTFATTWLSSFRHRDMRDNSREGNEERVATTGEHEHIHPADQGHDNTNSHIEEIVDLETEEAADLETEEIACREVGETRDLETGATLDSEVRENLAEERGAAGTGEHKHIDSTDQVLSLLQSTYATTSKVSSRVQRITERLDINDESDDCDQMKGQPRTKSDTEENQGLANQLQSMDWKWRCFEIIQQKSGRFSDKRRFRKQEEDTLHSEPFTVTYKRYLGGDVAANVTLLSALLIETVQELIPRTDMDYAEKPEISGKTLLLARHELEKCQQTATGDKRLHLQHLNRFVKEEYKDLLLQLERSLIQHSGTWDILWAVLTPGEVVLYECQLTTQKLSGTIVALMKAKEDNVEFWIVKVRVRDWDLQSYKEGIVERKILAYTGNRAFTALEVCPLKFFSDRKELEGRILRQGEIFYKLTMDKVEPRYMDYKGFMTLKKWSGRCWEMKKFPGDGRVMVDLKSFAKMNPGYPMGNAQPSCDLLRGATECSRIPKPDDEQLMRSPAFVYGYSFSRKSWGCFDVCGFSDIKFSSNSFSDLVMPDDVKQMLLKMVRQYVEHSNERGPEVDSIQHKGNGCVIMCYGPPGSGKTLTAESLAEKFERPLYSVNAFELPSTDPSALEEKLLQIFELVHTWRAILLLDEADVYMEKRSSTSVSNNNASTGIFLRQLEYFSGIMFLTTNRPKCFDPAIMSRISMSIRYPALNTGQRSRIWENMLRKAGLQGNIDTSRLGSHPFHGREIRNIISTAKLWGGKDWDMRQVNAVLQMQIKNAKEVEAYEDMSVEFE